jgi:hypothetical protein
MPLTTDPKVLALSRNVIEAFDKADRGPHAGFRPAHAKGILLTGEFRPSMEARIADAGTACPACVRSGDGALLRLRRISDGG